jgi:hypothetical protein
MQLDHEVARAYVRALIAIARADRQIDAGEGERLHHVIGRRFPGLDELDELLFLPTVLPEQLASSLRGDSLAAGPFRRAHVEPLETARMFVEDALEVLGTAAPPSPAAHGAIVRFASALGLSARDVRAEVDRALAASRR